MPQPLMPKATAVWLVDNTALTFEQIAEFVGMHELEISGIADGEVAVGIKGMDPIVAGQLTADEIKRCELNKKARLRLTAKAAAPQPKRKGPKYTPLSKRQDRPSAIAWLVRYHPELADSQIMKLVGTTKPTIESVRSRTHWNIANIRPIDPVALGLCKQMELDEAVAKAASRRAKLDPEAVAAGEEARANLMSTEESLSRDVLDESAVFGSDPAPMPEDAPQPEIDADSLFNLPDAPVEDDDEDDQK